VAVRDGKRREGMTRGSGLREVVSNGGKETKSDAIWISSSDHVKTNRRFITSVTRI
jgi:hypothetical protein